MFWQPLLNCACARFLDGGRSGGRNQRMDMKHFRKLMLMRGGKNSSPPDFGVFPVCYLLVRAQ